MKPSPTEQVVGASKRIGGRIGVEIFAELAPMTVAAR